MTDHLALLRIAATTAYDMADRMEPGTRVRAVAHAYASGIRHAETITQDAHDAYDPEATELRDGWHRLANHPAIRPPHWEPGNGQTYLEAVLEYLDARTAADAATRHTQEAPHA